MDNKTKILKRHLRSSNSVRNYYYKEVSTLQKNKTRCKSLNINLFNHKVIEIKSFSEKEEDNLKKQVENLINEGNSVRKSCLILANGDATNMIRIQNKYRALKRREQGLCENNIIKMPIKRNVLNDDDVKALFLGLVKLVKKQEYEKAKNIYEYDLNLANEKLKQVFNEIVEKDNKIEELKKKITLLQNQKEILRQKVECNKIDKESSAKKVLNKYFNAQKQTIKYNVK